MQPDAAMRCGPAEAFHIIGAVNGITAVKENRMWHRRIVVLSRFLIDMHSRRPIAADWRSVRLAPGRDRPSADDATVLYHTHHLAGDIDLGDKLGCSVRLGAGHGKNEYQQTKITHYAHPNCRYKSNGAKPRHKNQTESAAGRLSCCQNSTRTFDDTAPSGSTARPDCPRFGPQPGLRRLRLF